MMDLTEHNKHWLDHDGKVIEINGVKHKITCDLWTAKYPTTRRVIDVSATVCDKSCHYYTEHKEKLGDDWSVDLLASEPEFVAGILSQLSVS